MLCTLTKAAIFIALMRHGEASSLGEMLEPFFDKPRNYELWYHLTRGGEVHRRRCGRGTIPGFSAYWQTLKSQGSPDAVLQGTGYSAKQWLKIPYPDPHRATNVVPLHVSKYVWLSSDELIQELHPADTQPKYAQSESRLACERDRVRRRNDDTHQEILDEYDPANHMYILPDKPGTKYRDPIAYCDGEEDFWRTTAQALGYVGTDENAKCVASWFRSRKGCGGKCAGTPTGMAKERLRLTAEQMRYVDNTWQNVYGTRPPAHPPNRSRVESPPPRSSRSQSKPRDLSGAAASSHQGDDQSESRPQQPERGGRAVRTSYELRDRVAHTEDQECQGEVVWVYDDGTIKVAWDDGTNADLPVGVGYKSGELIKLGRRRMVTLPSESRTQPSSRRRLLREEARMRASSCKKHSAYR